MLNEVQSQLWGVYEAAEGRGTREDKLRALGAFLDSLAESATSEWFPWARALAARVVDEGLPIIIRRPLFVQAIFPALLAGHREGMPGCARWLAGLSDHVVRNRDCRAQLPETERSESGLLRAALRADANDRPSRRRLIEVVAQQLRYSLHELPSGLLYGMGAATPEQCRELEGELAEFQGWVAEEGQEELYRELVGRCRFHFRAYRDYLLNRGKHLSYANYLEQAGRCEGGP